MNSYRDRPRRRVAVTGTGVISSVGLSVEEWWESLLAGRSGIGPISGFDAGGLPVRIAAEVRGFTPPDHWPREVSRRLDRSALFALAAAEEAIAQAGLKIDPELGERTAVLVGSSDGPEAFINECQTRLRERGYRKIPAYYAATAASGIATNQIALWFGAGGPSASISTACATGATSIGEGMRLIERGDADVVIAGGCEDSISPLNVAGAAIAGALTRRNDEPERASRPFDRERSGFVYGAGAGVVVLEEGELARRRGATILAELAGYGAATDAYHLTAPHPEGLGAQRAMRRALEDAGVRPDEVDYINAHGTSTVLNDRIEVAAIRAVLGEAAVRTPVSSIKSMLGHMIGAAGAVEFIAAVQSLVTGMLPPTVNCDDPEDPEIDFVPHVPRRHDPEVVMSDSFGFGGHNAVLVARRWRDEPAPSAGTGNDRHEERP
ncbi:3-oxoacyl-[acyl-carrier-protein] synthase 2 [Actinomadura sp. NBRC 104412]|uniref:beta-ketoacyl-ACP synthase II n=1 Tax=Actinomadura sp. NBRC 104412 TaxID=3032203 RepID=UPI0024A4C811|nr:beta-ketoacyl-ACP synthase II [Actinomadura sp. NBRC 104412]GLZ06507.1 3-oxoacyl-[acyl-carrier-protein] synthase 2 [Actinomadura sp. NBRC 104412]